MQLPDEVLYQRLEVMPPEPENAMVWHLCNVDKHMQECVSALGNLALVTREVPDIPEQSHEGMFLIRLHPLKRDLKANPDDAIGTYRVWLPGAVSFPHSTVWSVPKPKVDNIREDENPDPPTVTINSVAT